MGKRNVIFDSGDKFWVKEYRDQNKTVWIKGKIIGCFGSRNYICRVLREDLIWKRHIDQLKKSLFVYMEDEGSVSKLVRKIDTSDLDIPNITVNK